MSKCNHKKVYSRILNLTYPAQYCWICELCGEEGSDSLQEGGYPGIPGRYKEVKEKIRKKNEQID